MSTIHMYVLELIRILCTQMNPEQRTLLPAVAFSGFAARFRRPTLEEGFEDITDIDFEVSNSAHLPLGLCASQYRGISCPPVLI